MLWIKVKVGEVVYIDEQPLTLIAKDGKSMTVSFAGQRYTISRRTSHKFPTFTLVPGNTDSGLRVGFDAPQSVHIRREKLET